MKRIILFALFIVLTLATAIQSVAQTSISDIINIYSAIDSVYPSKDTLEIASTTGFGGGDTVMIYQMKGAEVDLSPSPSNMHLWGRVKSTAAMNNTGKYEIILIKKIIDGNKILLKVPLDKSYDVDQPMQIIRVPSYKSASVDATLTCKAWDRDRIDGTGGVLALMVSDTLFMNADIDVSGKGFWGAVPYEIEGLCASTDSALYASYYFSENADTVSAGYKGEGITKFDTSYRRGKGRWATGGGGGNGRYSGGGGGGYMNSGGMGGAEDTTECLKTYLRDSLAYGLGGDRGFGFVGGYVFLINDSTLLMGGGGGSGTFNGPLTASNGGNGGGIVILMVKNLKTSGYEIKANGDSALVATASGGGGGAGGSVGFDVDTVVGDVDISVVGGHGGNAQYFGQSGPGGGGSGGIVLFRELKPSNVDSYYNGGQSGLVQEFLPGTSISFDAETGGPGKFTNNYDVPLTGFLFNYILDHQTICFGDVPEILRGSNPRGGDGNFIYKWQKSADNTSWIDADGVINSRDYQAPALTDTIFYRRVVTSAEIADTSYSIKIDVQLAIDNNQIFGDDLIICIDNEGDTITGTTVILGGDNSNYYYNWQLKTDSEDWNTVAALEDTVFLPGIITDTSYVRRIVSSGACYDTTANIEIIGLPLISNNILDPDQEICYDEVPVLIAGNLPSNGDGSYTYQWQHRTNITTWSDIPGANNQNYQPPALTDTTYYKRFVYSDDCEDESPVHTVVVLLPVFNDYIITGTPLDNCYGTQADINGSLPTGGNNFYAYKWQESIDNVIWSDIVANSENEDYQSVSLTSKVYFRRHVNSGACESYTDTLEINILDLPIATIADFEDTICSGEEVILDFDISSGQQPYSLVYNNGVDDFTENALISGLNNISINPVSVLTEWIFNYTVASVLDVNGCEATDMTGQTIITTYGNPESNAGPDEENCSLNYNLKAVATLGSGVWSQISGEGITSFGDKSKANSDIVVDTAGEYSYRWKEINWQCQDSADVNLTFYDSVANVFAGGDTSLFFIDNVELSGSYYNPDNIVPVESTWEFIQGDGTIENENNLVTNIADLFDVANIGIIVQWTVSKGVCDDKIDSVIINLKEIFTPSGFTPNGDGLNDYLKFNGLENAAEYELIIYNRWGTEVYRRKDNSNNVEWDGKNNKGKDLPEDTYYYLLMVKDKKGASETHKGFIVIKRS
ncbi:MAG: gliding motility-associated C-terminal domain-containing protein [Bacteroidales bacterium]|nr:gliding motility-associated C-terminal domain-containing protein [Bacteroidales bacterium]